MTKTIKSPVKEFPGKVTLPDFLTMPQVLLYERGIAEGRVLIQEGSMPAEVDAVVIPAICGIVESWELKNFPDEVSPETFPGSPRNPSANLIGWLIGEIGQLYNPVIPEE